jgi:hypothetical protein
MLEIPAEASGSGTLGELTVCVVRQNCHGSTGYRDIDPAGDAHRVSISYQRCSNVVYSIDATTFVICRLHVWSHAKGDPR